jgi:hypothetical protein
VGEGRHRDGIRRAFGDRTEHAPGTRPEEIGHQTRELDVHLFEQRLEPILKLHPVTRQLILAARHRPPQSLLGIGHETQGQFAGHQPPHQSLGIGEILLAAHRPAVRLGLREVQCP